VRPTGNEQRSVGSEVGATDKSDPAYKGQSGYNRFMLAIYDPWVLGFMAPVVWKAPIHPGVERYREHMGRRHLDVGPGTGYFIEKAEPAEGTEITLLDPNPKVLARSSRRLAALHPITVKADVMKPLPLEDRFDSAALSFVLHCLPGPQEHKAVAIRNIAAVLESDGVLFGGTVLGTEAQHSRAARGVLKAFNRQGAFDNLGDTPEGLREILEGSFQTVDVEVTRSIALFTATGPH
jgi:ubiquinone/menaquinone biosynthesis C-methylase UbiE